MNSRKLLLLIIFFAALSNSTFAVVTTWCDQIRKADGTLGWTCITVEGETCAQFVEHAGYTEGGKCTEQYFVHPPILIISEDGRTFLNNDGRISALASDRVKQFITTYNKGNFSSELSKVLLSDNGKVSADRVNALAKELGAKIVRANKAPVVNYCPPCEEEKRNMSTLPNSTTKSKSDQATIVAGAGAILPSSTMKLQANMSNLTSINLGAYVPLVEFGGATGGVISNYGGATGGVISLGFNVDVAYLNGNGAYDLGNYKPYNITAQSSVPTVVAKGAGSPKQAGFKTEGGAQANFSFGSYTISPIINLAYINLKQKAFNVVQNTSVNGQNYEHTLYSQAESKTSGMGAVAKLRHKYRFGRDSRFSVFAETNYMFGPSVTTQSAYFVPEGAANAQGNYNINQMNFGTQTSQTKSTKFNGFGLNAGIGLALGTNSMRKKAYRQAKKATRANATSNLMLINDPVTTEGGTQESRAAARRARKATRNSYSKITAIPNDNGNAQSNTETPLFSFDKQQEIGKDILGNQTLNLTNATNMESQDLKAVFIDPIMISFQTRNPELRKRLETDSVIISYSLKKDNNGNFYAMPFPIIGQRKANQQMQGCDNCNGCDEGGCGWTKFCFKLLEPEISTLSASVRKNMSSGVLKHEPTERKIYGKPTKLGSYTYQTSYNGEPVVIKIEYDAKTIKNGEPQNRPTGKWCVCCVGTTCWAWFTTNMNLDCVETCKKLNKMADWANKNKF